VSPAVASPLGDQFSSYQRAKIQWGATSLPLAAQLEYRAGLLEWRMGDRAKAEQHLDAAVKLAPYFPDAYFTLSWIKFRQFDPDALYYLVRGVKAMYNNFAAQSLLAVNAVLFAALALVLAISIVLLAFAQRYLPFVAHRLAESMSRRFRAAMPRTTAYLLISIPFALFPGFITGTCTLLLMTWHFMHRREKVGVVLLLAPFVLMGLFSSHLERFSPVADPTSFTTAAAQSNEAPGDGDLINELARAETPGLQADKHNAMGQLYLRREDYNRAAEQFLGAIALEPGSPGAYVNLGNVYYLQGQWQKALEGYSKAVSIDSLDAVAQYNLAQAYIKALLMAESSRALRMATAAGIDRVRRSYAEAAQAKVQVYPKTFSNGELWRMAAVEGPHSPHRVVAEALAPLLGFPLRVSAWMLLAALVVSMFLSRALKPRHLAFQCSNCGELMCESCGDSERGSFICAGCHGVIAEVTSEKVVDALLRQRRQKVVVKRRKRIRSLTMWLPGLRDIYYGKMFRGVNLSLLFALSLLALASRGYLVKDWNSLVYPLAAWKWILPSVGILFSFLLSVTSKRYKEIRNYRDPENRQRQHDPDEHEMARSA